MKKEEAKGMRVIRREEERRRGADDGKRVRIVRETKMFILLQMRLEELLGRRRALRNHTSCSHIQTYF